MIHIPLELIRLHKHAVGLHKAIEFAGQLEICRRKIIVEDVLIKALALGIVDEKLNAVVEKIGDGFIDCVEIEKQNAGVEIINVLAAMMCLFSTMCPDVASSSETAPSG